MRGCALRKVVRNLAHEERERETNLLVRQSLPTAVSPFHLSLFRLAFRSLACA